MEEKEIMTNTRIRRALPINQFFLLFVAILLLYLVADFGRQVIVHYQRQEELRQLQARVESAKDQTRLLESWLAYMQSPQAAAAWAREQGWTKPDEVPVVIVAPPAGLAAGSTVGSEAEIGSTAPREAWQELFFGEQ
jgi:cell division protein FtsB